MESLDGCGSLKPKVYYCSSKKERCVSIAIICYFGHGGGLPLTIVGRGLRTDKAVSIVSTIRFIRLYAVIALMPNGYVVCDRVIVFIRTV